ncbi:uncharacterized protein LOC126260663 [Schistocerca nitens]|uniref:uncharacterized protein LOC126260663 n=1 Tax=Schistocerca nitens TaxID=7011 RepID=UPI0021174E6E|nr:uncharacterized protein LOC126260663 [Schistocerca nitens]
MLLRAYVIEDIVTETFFHVQHDDKEDINTHVTKSQNPFVVLNDILQKHEEKVLSARILNGKILSMLGKEYDNFKYLWDTIPSKNRSVKLLIEKLCTIELRDQSMVGSAVFVSEKNVAFLAHVFGASVNNSFEVNCWYCDSGATNHIAANEQNFVSDTKFAVPEKISIGKTGVSMLDHGQETVKIQIQLKKSTKNSELREVLYVPEASAHLFSVKAVGRRGFFMRLNDKSVHIGDKVTGEIMMTGHVNHGLYVLDILVFKQFQAVQVKWVTSSDMLKIGNLKFSR